jgi:hypothetical protein
LAEPRPHHDQVVGPPLCGFRELCGGSDRGETELLVELALIDDVERPVVYVRLGERSIRR